jgi:hypothetical protein
MLKPLAGGIGALGVDLQACARIPIEKSAPWLLAGRRATARFSFPVGDLLQVGLRLKRPETLETSRDASYTVAMPQPRKYASDAERKAAYRGRQAEARRVELQAKGLPPVPAISTMPGTARWKALIACATFALTATHKEMEAYRDQRSESWQESEAAELLQSRIDAIESALGSLEEVE